MKLELKQNQRGSFFLHSESVGTMRNSTSWEENILKSEYSDYSDYCLNLNCSVVMISILGGILLLVVLVTILLLRNWRNRKREVKTKECLDTVEMEFQFLGSLYD